MAFNQHNNMASRINERIPFSFSNEKEQDPLIFISEFKEYVRLFEIQENQAKLLFKYSLKNEAKQWLQTLSSELSLGEIIERFENRFFRGNRQLTAIKQLYSARLGITESLRAFLDRMFILGQKANIGEETLVCICIKSLPGDLSQYLQMPEQQITWEILTTKCSNYLNWNHAESAHEINQIKTENLIENNEKVINAMKVKKFTKSSTSKVKCYFCGKQGHFMKDCWVMKNLAAKGKTARVNEVVKEEKRGEIQKGHEKFDSINELNYICLLNEDSLPYLYCTYNGKSLKVLIDTGSEVNLINKKMVKEYHIKPAKILLKGAGNQNIKCIGKIKNLKLNVGNESLEDTFFVVEGLKQSAIVGYNLLKKSKVKLNLSKRTLEINEKTSLEYHKIETGNAIPVVTPMYRIGNNLEKLVEKKIIEYLTRGIIRESKSPWRSPIIPIKKSENEIRLCVNYQKLNAITKKDNYPIPNVLDVFDNIGRAKFITLLDSCSAFHNIDIHPRDIEKMHLHANLEFMNLPKCRLVLQTVRQLFKE